MAEPKALSDARPERLDQHVSAECELASQRGVIGVVQVQHDRLLAPGDQRERRTVPECTPAGRFHTQDLRPEVGERLAGLRSRWAVGEVQDT